MSILESNCSMENGVILLTDVLGWKGKWKNEGAEPLEKMDTLLKRVERKISDIFDKKMVCKENYKKFIGIEKKHIKVISISDTIAIIIHCDEANKIKAMELMAVISAVMIAHSIKLHIPLRGAMSYGKLRAKDNIIIGKAVDEVSAWYEAIECIGVVLTPSLSLGYNSEDRVLDKARLVKHDMTFKKYGKINSVCVDWTYTYENSCIRNRNITEIYDDLYNSYTDIGTYVKLTNTIEFYNRITKMRDEECAL